MAALAWLFLAGACASSGLEPSGGGLAHGDAARISAVVAQTRAQFPGLSTVALPYTPHEAPTPGTGPEAVLRGSGSAVTPGVQLGDAGGIEVTLLLNKPGYDGGSLEISFEGGTTQTWPLIAFEHRGEADGAFEFLYTFAAPDRRLRYLAVIGGHYKEEGGKFLGLEGTLIFPGPGGRIDGWEKAYKIAFGRRMPLVPAYQPMVAEAESLFKKMSRRHGTLESLRSRIREASTELARLEKGGAAAPADGASSAAATTGARQARQARLADGERAGELRGDLQELQVRFAGLLEEGERTMERYFELRALIAAAFAEFTAANQYTWALLEQQQDYYDDWKQVELHHPRIDELAERLSQMLPDPAGLNAARASAMATVKRHDNWSRDPTRLKDRSQANAG